MTLESWTRRPGWEPAARWHLSRPFRALAGIRVLPRGRGFFSRLALGIAWRTIQPGSAIYAQTPGGGSVEFRADTLIGRFFWTMGAFEQSELLAAFRSAAPGTYAFDVGANVGLFTVVMSRAVGPTGRVVAVEPVADTVRELRDNLERNRCINVDVVEGAAAASTGEVPLILTDDPALHSTRGEFMRGHPTIQTITVKAYTLDEMWIAAGQPRVSLVKIDVEGGEEEVLLGAAQMIRDCQPALIIEVNDPSHVRRVAESLRGYRTASARGFEPWNHLMVPG
jgi:FkbM family methyltransferase